MSNYNPDGTKRVGFSLSTIDSGAPEEPQHPHWDSETDHLLSYFLGDPSGQTTPGQASYQDFLSAPQHSTEMNPPLGMTASYGPGSSRTSSNSTLTEAAEPPQPRTPAMQFYHHPQPTSCARPSGEHTASTQGQSQLISSSSSSSLSSMAAALVSGAGPVSHLHHRHFSHTATAPSGNHSTSGEALGASAPRDSPPACGDESPVSPAAFIGGGHENLMLPPPSRRPITVTRTSSASTTQHTLAQRRNSASESQHSQRQRSYFNAAVVYPGQKQSAEKAEKEEHLEWLKQINSQISAGNQTGNQEPLAHQLQGRTTAVTGIAPSPVTRPLVNMHQPAPSPQARTVGQHSGAMSVAAPAPAHVFHPGSFPNTAVAVAAAAAAAVAQNPMLYQAAFSHKFHMAAQGQGESEEKRARRLERNRESARKSRRRKKERLAQLESQVDKLHTQIEVERRNQVNAMCAKMKQVRKDEFTKLLKCVNEVGDGPDKVNTERNQQRLADMMHCSSCGSSIALSATEFQYNTLRQVLLPRYQKFLLWLTLHDEAFFMAGKDEYTRKDGKQVLRVSSGRVSSKQIGDELMNGWKTEKGDGRKKNRAETADIAERANPTSRSLEAARMWPLLCFELSISVDQEERLLQALKRLQQVENLPLYRSQLGAATKLTTSLTAAISSQSQVSTARENRSLVQVLTPAQTVKFHEWVTANQEQFVRVFRGRHPAPGKCYPVVKETSLIIDFCRRLDEVLRISKKEQDMDTDLTH